MEKKTPDVPEKPDAPEKPDVSSEKKTPELPTANPSEVEVTFSEPCIFSGKEKKVGDKLTVTKQLAKHLASRKLIK